MLFETKAELSDLKVKTNDVGEIVFWCDIYRAVMPHNKGDYAQNFQTVIAHCISGTGFLDIAVD